MSQSQKIQIIMKWLELSHDEVALVTDDGQDEQELSNLLADARRVMRERITEERLTSMA